MKTDRCMGVSRLPVSTAPVGFYLRVFLSLSKDVANSNNFYIFFIIKIFSSKEEKGLKSNKKTTSAHILFLLLLSLNYL